MKIYNITSVVKDGYAWMKLKKRKQKRIVRRVVKDVVNPKDVHSDAPHMYADYLAGRITHTYELYIKSDLEPEIVHKILSMSFDKFLYSVIIQQKSEMNAAKSKTSSILEKNPSYN